MKNSEFAIWLNGFFEICPDAGMDSKKLYIIKNHLNLVKAVEGEWGEPHRRTYKIVSEAIEAANDEAYKKAGAEIRSINAGVIKMLGI